MNKADITDTYLHGIISECEGRDWVNTGTTTSNHDSMFTTTKNYLANPRLMLEHGEVDMWGENWRGGDRISNMTIYYWNIGAELAAFLMGLAFDNATEEELKEFSLHATAQVVREEAARRYGERHKELKYLPRRLENGYSRKPCWRAA